MSSFKKDAVNRAMKIRHMCPVVAVTAYNDKSFHVEAAKIGIKKVMHKPVNSTTLKDTLDTFFYRKNKTDVTRSLV
jgi:FixJ family two-component response regulator